MVWGGRELAGTKGWVWLNGSVRSGASLISCSVNLWDRKLQQVVLGGVQALEQK